MPCVSLRFSYGLFCLQCTDSSALYNNDPPSTSTGEEFPSIKSLRRHYCKLVRRAQPLLMTDSQENQDNPKISGSTKTLPIVSRSMMAQAMQSGSTMTQLHHLDQQ